MKFIEIDRILESGLEERMLINVDTIATVVSSENHKFSGATHKTIITTITGDEVLWSHEEYHDLKKRIFSLESAR